MNARTSMERVGTYVNTFFSNEHCSYQSCLAAVTRTPSTVVCVCVDSICCCARLYVCLAKTSTVTSTIQTRKVTKHQCQNFASSDRTGPRNDDRVNDSELMMMMMMVISCTS